MFSHPKSMLFIPASPRPSWIQYALGCLLVCAVVVVGAWV